MDTPTTPANSSRFRRKPKNPDGRMPLMDHIRELRTRLIKAVLGVIAGAIIGYIFYRDIFTFLTHPICDLTGVRGVGQPTPGCRSGLLTTTGVLGPFSLALKIALFSGLILASPVWLYQVWAFLAPGLYRNEKKFFYLFIGAGIPLFLGGAALAYALLPEAFKVLLGLTPGQVSNNITTDSYLTFVTRLVLVFGLSFELPVVLVMLNLSGALSAARMRRWWRGIIFGIFVVAATLVPTGDPITMCLLAVPMCVLFGVALLIAAAHDRRKAAARAADPDARLSDDEASRVDLTPSRIDDTEPPERSEQRVNGFTDST